MRQAFVDRLTLIASEDDTVMLLVGDLGYGVVDDFARRYPDRFINVGVAEQNMIGVAAGLASAGFRPFVYSISNFSTFRCLEQIRNDVCFEGLPVSIVSVGAGLAYGTLGYSHFAVEDIAVMRTMPGLMIVSPADAYEASVAVSQVLEYAGPSYIRLGKGGERMLHSSVPSTLLRPITMLPGSDLSLVGTGASVETCIEAARMLGEQGVEAEVVSWPTLKPLAYDWLQERRQNKPIVVVEDHRVTGGFGSLVLEALNDLKLETPCNRLGLRDEKLHVVGSTAYLRQAYGLTAQDVFEVCREVSRIWEDSN